MSEFFEALGRFILAYSYAESTLKRAASAIFELPTPAGLAIFGGQRVKPIIDAIRRGCEAKEMHLHELLNEALIQFAHINQMRDSLLHFGFSRTKNDEYLSSNADIVHSKSKIKKIPITVQDLVNMTEDLNVIELRMLAFCIRHKDKPEHLKRLHKYALAPFLYIPRQPALKSAKTENKTQKSKSQLPSSPD